MFLTFFVFLMKFADISKLHSQRCPRGDECNRTACWQHVARMQKLQQQQHQFNTKKNQSTCSSTSSGCDSNASTTTSSTSTSSSKENCYSPNTMRQQQQQQQNPTITPQQLQELRYYQQLQSQHLHLLQQQLLQRRRLQRQNPTNSSATLTCNQQFLLQQRLQQQQHNNYNNNVKNNFNNNNNNYNNNNNNNNNINNNNKNNVYYFNESDILNNNNNNWSFGSYNGGFGKGHKSRRGMTEFPTVHDINNKSHLSQPLQNSPRHHFHAQTSPSHYAKELIYANDKEIHQNNHHKHNNKNNQQKLPFDSTANNIITRTTTNASVVTTSSSPTNSSATHSPQHYRNPSNSPNNTPYTNAAYYGGGENQHKQQQQQQKHSVTKSTAATTTATTANQQQRQYHQLQQHLRGNSRLPFLTHAQYQKYLNDLLLQQQNLQQQKQQLLSSKHPVDEDELSEESLKQNVAIVLNNLDRYNSALRSIILNEQVTANSSGFFFDDNLLISDTDGSNFNNNYLLNAAEIEKNKMAAAAATPESDYNSNATTPGSRGGGGGGGGGIGIMSLDSNLLQQQQNSVGGVLGGGANNVVVSNGGSGFCSFGNNLNCSIASSHDFTHDNSDYQWFLDYGYRDGCGGMQRSVLSSLSASYNGLGDLIYYEDLAKNLDANLAEVDMESFRAEDIHSLLSHLPSYCKSLGSENNRLQQSLLLQQQQQQQHYQQCQHQQLQQHHHQQQQQQHQIMYQMASQQHGHNVSQTSTTSTNELIDNSICKSELLFSPVKESHISVDSLDMDAYPDDGDIILTCKANKENYTIAFEGSVLYSDESFYEPYEISMKNKQNFINLHSNLDDIVKRKALEVSMSRSEQAFTPNNKSQKNSTTQLQRYPSGNNNTSDAIPQTYCHAPNCLVRKSNSLPNLVDSEEHEKATPIPSAPTYEFAPEEDQPLNVSHALSVSTIMDCCKSRNLLPMCQMPISSTNSNSASISERSGEEKLQMKQIATQQRHKHRCCCSHSSSNQSHNSASTNTTTLQQQQQQQQQHQQHKTSHISGSASSGNSSNPPAFNLVKLFIKQKSNNSSSEEAAASAHTCMDVSSGCWPSSDAAGSSSSSSLEQRLRKKSMNDSGKGSALSRHEEEIDHLELRRKDDDSAFHMDEKLAEIEDNGEYKTIKRSAGGQPMQINNSPAHRRRSIPLRHPQLCQLAIESACSIQSSEGSRSNSEQITQVYLSSAESCSSTEKKLRQFGSTRQQHQEQQQQQQQQQHQHHGSSTDMVTRSIQTSCGGDVGGGGGSLSTRSSLNDRYRCVPPSFLSKLNNLTGEEHAPIYVIYPNYALPDLGFVKTHASSTDVIFSPFNYKMAVGNSSSNVSLAALKKRFSVNPDDDELLKTMDYKHVEDWESLATLLPIEYRKRLRHIPQVSSVLRQMGNDASQRPLFCMSPPIRRSRPNLCDCAQFIQQQQLQQHQTQTEETNSSSGSSQQPSSGYRGSSTLLTDESQTESGGAATAAAAAATAVDLKQMYVYQYDQQRMDSGVEMSPSNKIAPQPRPRGILRKSSSVTARTKRNSMIEEETNGKLTKLEKRRSLQEPPNQHGIGSSEEQLYDVFEEETDLYVTPKPRKERLSRKEMDARVRAENFLSSLPRSELKHYAEIAAILESSEDRIEYDPAALKKEVSRALSQQKKVSFNDGGAAGDGGSGEIDENQQQIQNHHITQLEKRHQRFSTPPNSPIISTPKSSNANTTTQRRCAQVDQYATRKLTTAIDDKEQRKIESNRFKRLQIQWELMSKDSNMLKELANAQETKSGGSTPTSATSALKSRIPRPVSYPAGRINPQEDCAKKSGIRSPSRIVPPKRYSIASITSGRPVSANATTPSPTGVPTATTPTSATRTRTPNSRAAVTAPNTPKRRVQSPRTPTPKVR